MGTTCVGNSALDFNRFSTIKLGKVLAHRPTEENDADSFGITSPAHVISANSKASIVDERVVTIGAFDGSGQGPKQ